MEKLPEWLDKRYNRLREHLAERDFAWKEAAKALGEERTDSQIPSQAAKGTVADLLARLERFGYLEKEVDPFDQRVRSYRLINVARAQALSEQLEAWRLQAAQEAPPLAEAIDQLWSLCRQQLRSRVDLSAVPQQPGQLTLERARGVIKLSDLRMRKAADLTNLEDDDKAQAEEILKLFDASANAYRSVTNVLLEYEKLRSDLEAGTYDLPIGNYATVDSVPLQVPKKVANKSLCPICRRFPQKQNALALITGNPKMDSIFQTHRSSKSKRASIKVCDYCFTAGWVDLPTASITKDGQSIGKGREYLFITTPLGRAELEALLDFITEVEPSATGQGDEARDELQSAGEVRVLVDAGGEEDNEEDEDEEWSPATFAQGIEEKFGVQGYDKLAVLGMSKSRLQELRGFVLPSTNPMLRVVGVRVPIERLVGEDKVSGAVRRELMKATMYDFWQITGGSLHYNQITSALFSVEGQVVALEEMRRANVAYKIANSYARVGKYRQLNSGLFMLLLSQPRYALNQILRNKRREKRGRYAPKSKKVREMIEMAEENAVRDEWQFQLGLRIVEVLVALGLAPQAKGFWYRDRETGGYKQYTSVDLVKWIQRIKMIHDPDSARAWGTSLINGYRREHDAGPNTEVTERILGLVEEIIQTCSAHDDYPLQDFARGIANMDYYLLFYYNQRIAPKKGEEA